MPIISRIEAKSRRGRLVHGIIILLLTIGSLTMIYPFMIMTSGSLRSQMDQTDLDVIPAFLIDTNVLYKKVIECKYNIQIIELGRQYRNAYYSFKTVQPPANVDADMVQALRRYLKRNDLPEHWTTLGGIQGGVPQSLREMRNRLKAQFHGDLGAISKDIGSPASSWLAIVINAPDWIDRRFDYTSNSLWNTYLQLKNEADPVELYVTSITGQFLQVMIYPYYGAGGLEGFNKDNGTKFASFEEFNLPATMPGEDKPVLRKQWIEFVRSELNTAFISLKEPDNADYQRFIASLYDQKIAELNKSWGTVIQSFDEISLPQGYRWLHGSQRQDYEQYLDRFGPEDFVLIGPEYDWPQWLVAQGIISDAAQAPQIPMAQMEYVYALENAGSLRWRYAISNFQLVWEELVMEGRALYNTVVYCVASILLALLVNPLAAYGLSRFRLPGTYKFLLILMATVAFPTMVTLIPQFILLRQLNLMNTLLALVLPMAANGYLIFLLKGFFDSLPQELYEAASLDGAGEIRMFFQIAMSLSRPILAVLALNTFTAAYSAFIYPLLVAPNPDNWLISIWLYQFQQGSSSPAVYASVIIASIPTLVIFLFVQRTIMKGIIVPTEK